jgi:hypothetical protein
MLDQVEKQVKTADTFLLYEESELPLERNRLAFRNLCSFKTGN